MMGDGKHKDSDNVYRTFPVGDLNNNQTNEV
jgi:hypothetical protein